jgi:hypothetical protein
MLGMDRALAELRATAAQRGGHLIGTDAKGVIELERRLLLNRCADERVTSGEVDAKLSLFGSELHFCSYDGDRVPLALQQPDCKPEAPALCEQVPLSKWSWEPFERVDAGWSQITGGM